MDELINHLNRNDLSSLYPNEFNHIMGSTYNIIRRAIRDGADSIKLTSVNFVWSKEGKLIGERRIDRLTPTVSYQESFRTILSRDKVIQQFVHVTGDTPDELTVQFLTERP